MNNSLPVNLIVEGRKCIVIGAGAVADGKVEILASRGADVTVIAPDIAPDIEALAEAGRVRIERRNYRPGDLEGAFFVVCGTDDRDTNEAVWREALERGILVNVVDDTPHCTAIFPAIVRRGSLQISISTDGKSPAVAVRVKEHLQETFGDEYAELLDILGEARPMLAGWRTQKERAAVWYEIVDSGILKLIADGRGEEARRHVHEVIAGRRAGDDGDG